MSQGIPKITLNGLDIRPRPANQPDRMKELSAVTETYRERHSMVVIVRLLNRLISAVQRHRGVSLAHLAGSGLFMEDVNLIQSQVNRRIWVLNHCCENFDQLVPQHLQDNLQHSWNTVCHDWEGDSVLENFEYHSFLIDQMIQLNADLVQRLSEPFAVTCELPETETSSPQPDLLSEWVIQLVSKELPRLVEHLAKIRGLSTHAAVIGKCDEEHDKKLRFWIQCVEDANRTLLRQIDVVDPAVKSQWRSLTELKNYELKLAFFLNSITRDILHGDCEQADARNLFTLGSEIIEAFFEAVDGGIYLLESAMETDMESWLSSR